MVKDRIQDDTGHIKQPDGKIASLSTRKIDLAAKA